MKLIYPLLFLLLAVCACKKEPSPAKLEKQKLEAMRKYIVNDWTIVKMMILKPSSQYGLEASFSTCDDYQTFSFRSDSSFLYQGNPACNNKDVFPGTWSLPKTDSLFIHFSWNTIVCYENIKVTEITPGRMKWIMTAATGDGNPYDTLEYTLVPKWY